MIDKEDVERARNEKGQYLGDDPFTEANEAWVKKHKTFFRDYLLNYESLQRGINNEIVLFSPGFPSFDEFENYQKRGEAFHQFCRY